MKAAQMNAYGDASVITINEVDKPAVGPGKVLVEVYAASLNPFDSKLRAGVFKDVIPLQLPATLGGDIAGVVAEVGEGVDALAEGDRVFGQASAVAGNGGAIAEYAATSASQIAKAPANLDFQQAAALPLVGVSALQALTQHIKLQGGQKLFVHGGAGGIGLVALQIAKRMGAYVATTATGEGMNLVKQFGADEVIDYKTEDFVTQLHNFDAVFDTVGGDDFNESLQVLRRGGIAVSMVTEAEETKAEQLGVTAIYQSTKVTTEKLDRLRDLVEQGAVTPYIGKVFPLDQTREAFEAREAGTVNGKVVISVR